MPTVQPNAPDFATRRMLAGLLLSVLVHGVVLSIRFGLPGGPGESAGPITVSLTPAPSVSPEPLALPPAVASLPSAAPLPAPPATPGTGFRMRDPLPMAPPPPAPQAATRPAARRRAKSRPRAPRDEASTTPVIVQQDNPDAAFKLPLADARPEPVPEPVVVADTASQAHEDEQAMAAEEARRLAQLQEEERIRAAEQEARLAAEREAEDRRIQDDQLRQAREQEQRQHEAQERALVQQRAEQRTLEEDRVRASAREAERLANEEHARRAAAERELAARQMAEQATRQREADLARQRAEQLAQEQLAQQQLNDERARRQRAEQIAVQDELARQQAIQEARRQAHEAAEAERTRQAAQAGAPGQGGLPASVPGDGTGAALPGGALGSAGLASRARELMRGIELPAAPPAALRPAQQMAEGRRRVVDTLERDVPLRLYVDSFRQKIERNAAQIRMQLAGGPGRADPLVSVALRSDGSVDDVTIVRSSGRPDTDEAVRRIVRLNARYAAFPPGVAARFDVIEIRRIWLFSETLKLLEEVR